MIRAAITREEHLLILTMLIRQQMPINVILNSLRSREIASEDDLRAFDFAVRQDAESNVAFASTTIV